MTVKQLRDAFFARLEEKTNWGRNQIRQMFDESLIEQFEDVDVDMDGDHDSAMASAGMGTDEDYGAPWE